MRRAPLPSTLHLTDRLRCPVEQPRDADNVDDVYETLNAIVAQTLAYDKAAIPASARHLVPEALAESPSVSRASPQPSDPGESDLPQDSNLSDPDDFVIYSTDEAEHIAYAIEVAFDVDLASEVVLAAANVRTLSHRIIEARSLLKPKTPAPNIAAST